MGADLITWTLVGPKHLAVSRGKRENILNCCNETVYAARRVRDGKGKARHKLLVEELDEYEIDRLAGLKPAEVLNCFLDVWNNTPFRDTTSRLFRPGNRGKWYKIVVAGDMSWGDDPDGAGYQTINEARLLGLFPLLGVR